MQKTAGTVQEDTATLFIPLQINHPNFYAIYVKRWVDVGLAAIGLLLCIPIFVVLFVLIVLDSKGHPLYLQRRIGLNGKPFVIFKLRTMAVGADADRHRFSTLESDERVTKIGKLLRPWKLDELPQLWNVITGDMSLIGPRPLSTRETKYLSASLSYDTHYPGFQPKVRPGLTGLEQIRRNRTMTYRERFALNEEYESNVTWEHDLEILLATFSLCRIVSIATIIGAIVETTFLGVILACLNILT